MALIHYLDGDSDVMHAGDLLQLVNVGGARVGSVQAALEVKAAVVVKSGRIVLMDLDRIRIGDEVEI
jgi:hypothetical protein